MNAGGRDACGLAKDVAESTRAFDRVDVVVAPPFTAIAAVAHEIFEARGGVEVPGAVGVAGQNMHASGGGAYTGEIAASMLLDAGATWVLIGHSERRQLFGETDDGVAAKVRRAFESGLRPIVCVGETLEERDENRTLEVVEDQVRAFMEILGEHPGVGVIAYEPVWAIGTGKVAKPEDAQEVHGWIRSLLVKVSEELSEATRLLYGGSVKADNADGLLSQEDIDGALVGGASLDAKGFAAIAAAAQAIALKEQAEASEEQDARDDAREATDAR